MLHPSCIERVEIPGQKHMEVKSLAKPEQVLWGVEMPKNKSGELQLAPPALPGPAARLTCSKALLPPSLPPSHPGRARALLPPCSTLSQLPKLQGADRQGQESWRGRFRGVELLGRVEGHSFSAIHFKEERAWKAPKGTVAAL